MKFTLKLLLLIGTAAYGYSRQGISGSFYALMLLGLLLFGWYLMCGFLFSFVNLFQREPTYNITIQQGDSIKGQEYPDVEGKGRTRHPDPTRPTEEDFKVLTWRRPQ